MCPFINQTHNLPEDIEEVDGEVANGKHDDDGYQHLGRFTPRVQLVLHAGPDGGSRRDRRRR